MPRRIPQLVIRVDIYVLLTLAIRHWQSAASADRLNRRTDDDRRPLHRSANFAQMLKVGPRADVHMQSRDRKLVLLRALDALLKLLVPNAMLRLRAARIHLLAVTMPEAGID